MYLSGEPVPRNPAVNPHIIGGGKLLAGTVGIFIADHGNRLIFFRFLALQKMNQRFAIGVKYLVRVDIEEPFPLCAVEGFVSGRAKIPAPWNLKQGIRIFFRNFHCAVG